ncbi:hypothetical protein PACILC2_06840 [Paenibacillus cisolokensis]|uniref:HTH cro/C1-type domain-containing protein n=1 Tax=Paenibacillus cisolokensis TaxID=1658519 RepID=A0ABQ4N2B7_9BACL|nr:helix-turn-helix transcriptional regulator [Paenibacillus cisolokensis]GIQ62116.1 hypothetical protein PACILC2_06840 [Paenibacillus cisolokensis]
MGAGENIKKLRNRYGLSQQELAEIAGVTNKAVSAWENGHKEPRMGTIEKIANHFGLRKSSLIEDGGMDAEWAASSASAPSWASSRDKRDFKRMLEEDAPVMFDGVPLDDEDKEKVLKVMEAIFWDAKKKNKRKPINE